MASCGSKPLNSSHFGSPLSVDGWKPLSFGRNAFVAFARIMGHLVALKRIPVGSIVEDLDRNLLQARAYSIEGESVTPERFRSNLIKLPRFPTSSGSYVNCLVSRRSNHWRARNWPIEEGSDLIYSDSHRSKKIKLPRFPISSGRVVSVFALLHSLSSRRACNWPIEGGSECVPSRRNEVKFLRFPISFGRFLSCGKQKIQRSSRACNCPIEGWSDLNIDVLPHWNALTRRSSSFSSILIYLVLAICHHLSRCHPQSRKIFSRAE